jgi:hypothetical protein
VFAAWLRRTDVGFEFLTIDPREAFLPWSSMFPNTERMFAAFEDVDAS